MAHARTLEEIVPSLPARSVALSLLLGAGQPRLSANELVTLGGHFGISPTAMRVALSRMVSAGELDLEDSVYVLTERHLRRQKRTEEMIDPQTRDYEGAWRTIILTGTGRSASERAETRAELQNSRFAMLREGVWLRPDNLAQAPPRPASEHVVLDSVPDNEQMLVGTLWELGRWEAEAWMVMAALRSGTDNMRRLRAAAAAVRLLIEDPVLPAKLVPQDWPAHHLREEYERFRSELSAVHIPEMVDSASLDS